MSGIERDKLQRVIKEAARTGAKELYLSWKDLTELPAEISQLPQLKVLKF